MTSATVAKATTLPRKSTNTVQNLFKRQVGAWVDKGGKWLKVIPGRDDASRRKVAAEFFRFVRAYLAVVSSGCEDPGDLGVECQEIESFLERKRKDGEIPMSAVIASFESCPADVFVQTLALLMWAGHVKSLQTLNGYKVSFAVVVRAYAENQRRRTSRPANRVCFTLHCHLYSMLRDPLRRECGGVVSFVAEFFFANCNGHVFVRMVCLCAIVAW